MRWVLDDAEAREAGLLSLARSLAPARLATGESVSEWRTWRERSRRGGPRDRALFFATAGPKFVVGAAESITRKTDRLLELLCLIP